VSRNSKDASLLKFGLLENDLDQILIENSSEFKSLERKKVLILGGTGFIGSWISKAIVNYNSKGGSCELTIASRNVSSVKNVFIDIKTRPKTLSLDISRDAIEDICQYDLVINCATPSSVKIGSENVDQLYRTITDGSRNLIESLSNCDNKLRFVNISSGAVTALTSIVCKTNPEACPKEHTASPSGAYSHGKSIAEKIVENASATGLIDGVSLRLFAFIGPGLPLDQHFAAGNFMANALKKSPILIRGNPNTVRSYQYPTDLVREILKAATSSNNATFEVGSREPIEMNALAQKISQLTSNVEVTSGDSTAPISEYFPQTPSENMDSVSLDDAIKRWWKWLKINST
jgi:dTDP-glucose 4,6-dehydratase